MKTRQQIEQELITKEERVSGWESTGTLSLDDASTLLYLDSYDGEVGA
jgi:hypothetical protein